MKTLQHMNADQVHAAIGKVQRLYEAFGAPEVVSDELIAELAEWSELAPTTVRTMFRIGAVSIIKLRNVA